jgi:hypothetical protein
VQHDVHAVLVKLRHCIALEDHVARKDGHVGPKVNRFAAVELKGLAEVTEFERVNEPDACAAIEQRIDDIRLGVTVEYQAFTGGGGRDTVAENSELGFITRLQLNY